MYKTYAMYQLTAAVIWHASYDTSNPNKSETHGKDTKEGESDEAYQTVVQVYVYMCNITHFVVPTDSGIGDYLHTAKLNLSTLQCA